MHGQEPREHDIEHDLVCSVEVASFAPLLHGVLKVTLRLPEESNRSSDDLDVNPRPASPPVDLTLGSTQDVVSSHLPEETEAVHVADDMGKVVEHSCSPIELLLIYQLFAKSKGSSDVESRAERKGTVPEVVGFGVSDAPSEFKNLQGDPLELQSVVGSLIDSASSEHLGELVHID